MVSLKNVATAIELGAGESIIIKVHPDGEVTPKPGRQGGTVWHIPVSLDNGKTSTLRGGERLISALQEAMGNADGPVRLKVTAIGEAGTVARDWKIERIA